MIFDLKLGIIKDYAMYVVSLDQLHSLMCFAIIKSAVSPFAHSRGFL